jgi:hypothetical protein
MEATASAGFSEATVQLRGLLSFLRLPSSDAARFNASK